MKKILLFGLASALMLAGCSEESKSVKKETPTELSKKETTKEKETTTEVKQKETTSEKTAQAEKVETIEDAQFIFYHQDFVTENADDLEHALENIQEAGDSYTITVTKKGLESKFEINKNGDFYLVNQSKKTVMENSLPLEALVVKKALEKHFERKEYLQVDFDHVEDLKLVFQVYEVVKDDEKTSHTATYDWVTYDTSNHKFTSMFPDNEDYSDVVVD